MNTTATRTEATIARAEAEIARCIQIGRTTPEMHVLTVAAGWRWSEVKEHIRREIEIYRASLTY